MCQRTYVPQQYTCVPQQYICVTHQCTCVPQQCTAFHNNAPAFLPVIGAFYNNAPAFLVITGAFHTNAPVLLNNAGVLQIRSATMPALTLGAFALRLATAFRTWHDPTHGAALTYFAGNRARHGGDELRLRASLIKDHLLAQGFGYASASIEIEAADRADVVLYAGSASDRRAVALIETKRSGFTDLLNTRLATGETAPQQLARYVRLRGLYLGALTNGDTWHFFDFSVSLQPRASLQLTALVALLEGVTTAAQAELALAAAPVLANALVVAQAMLETDKWTAVAGYLAELNAAEQFQSKLLTTAADRVGLITQIKQRLSLLRDTILAQFAVLSSDLARYEARRIQVSATDTRPYAEELTKALDLLAASIADQDDRTALLTLIHELLGEFAQTNDPDWFYTSYIEQAQVLLTYHQAALPGMATTTMSSPVPIPNIEQLVKLLAIHAASVGQLTQVYASSVRLQRAYTEWQRRVRGVYANPEREFCLQTGYIHFVRLFFVRVCEDHGFIPRRISNGPFIQFDAYRQALLEGVSDVYTRLLHETFERAANVYHNFFSRADLYDWFTLDERSILGLLAVLNRYDFSQLDFDLLGNIYNEGYIEEQRRSEHGQFYTPHAAVQYMVNSLGLFPRCDPADPSPLTPEELQCVERSVIDLSCGSGSFLVEIAARKAAVLQRMVNLGAIKPANALEHLVNTLAGIDISPFACYLAEINLLIRCMPFMRETIGSLVIPRSIERLHIYCSDTLEPTGRERVDFHSGQNSTALRKSIAGMKPARITEEELLTQELKNHKTIPGRLLVGKRGFDVVIGNPPYVKANESPENSRYRDQIRSWGFYPLHDKWDLFVPFVYRNLEFLADDGWMSLITTNAIETEGYAKELRAELNRFWLEQLDFFPKLKLFGPEIGVHNTIFQLQKRQGPNPALQRRIHRTIDTTTYAETSMDQALGPDAFFRPTYVATPPGMMTACVPLCAIAYIGTGLEAHSHERYSTNVRGQRRRAFDLDESFRVSLDGLAPAEAAHFTDRGVVGAEVQAYYLTQRRYVAYAYMKDKLRRQRIPELFRTPQKLLLGETSGGYYDTEQLFANHSVQVVVPWHALTVDEPGVKKVRKHSMALAGSSDLDTIAQQFDLRYVLAVINSAYMRRYLLANQAQGTREGRIYPDVWKLMPVKVIAPTHQAALGALVDDIQALQRTLQAAPHEREVFAVWLRDGKLTGKLTDYIINGKLGTVGALGPTRKRRYTREGEQVILFERTGIRVTDPTATPLLDYFCWYCNVINESVRGYPWATMGDDIPLPQSLSNIAALLAEVEAVRGQQTTLTAALTAKQAALEQAVIDAYSTDSDTSLWQTVQGLLSCDS